MSSTPPPSSTSQVANYDTPWKIAIEQHFRQFIAFYFPAAHEEIDWDGGYEFLDKELQAITKDALVGTRHVDKLVKVMHRSGHERWLLVHIEVQMSRQAQFAERMFIYNYRIFDRYHHPVASLAVLGDDDPRWLPQEFGYAALGSRMAFHFPVAKLASWTKPLRGENPAHVSQKKLQSNLTPHSGTFNIQRGYNMIKPQFPADFEKNYQTHLKRLELNGMQPKTIEAYSHAVRRAGKYFDYQIDALTEDQFTEYFSDLLSTHSWSTLKHDLYGLKFYYEKVLHQPWPAPDLVKPPSAQRLPDILTIEQMQRIIASTKVLSYRVFFYTIYSLCLRLGLRGPSTKRSAVGAVKRASTCSATRHLPKYFVPRCSKASGKQDWAFPTARRQSG